VFEHLTWLPDRVLLGDLVFRLEHAQSTSWELGDDCFRFYKNREIVDQYARFWGTTRFRPRRMLEIGIWDGGSAAFWFEHLRPERLVAIDLQDREDNAYFRRYVDARGLHEQVRTRWRTNQADRTRLRSIVADDLGSAVDLVIDDGSHLSAPTRATFETVFPLLPAGGLYIIEDWAWEHWPEFQDPGHFWAGEESLAPLVGDLVAATGSSKTLIRSVSVFEGFTVVERGDAVIDTNTFRLADHIRRRPWRTNVSSSASTDGDVKAFAFYLPQFHPIPENDRWWGQGFTEWTRVSRAQPQFAGHYQPHVPGALGFYDLRLPEIRQEQVALAGAHGINGFCFYYYWFGGKTLLDRPLREMLTTGEPDFPFCFMWANENWTRRWDGAERAMLIEQRYAPELDFALIEDLVPYFRDRRYLRVNGAPVMAVYRPTAIPDPRATTARWRQATRKHGLPDLHLVAALTFEAGDPRPMGFDAAMEFPPHGLVPSDDACKVDCVDPAFVGNIIDYRAAVYRQLTRPATPFRLYRTAMAGWDNTARLGRAATIFHESTPTVYEWWLREIAAAARLAPPEHRLVFVNAWNEWAEGAHLEPDERFGTGYLEATRRALAG
jgi:hypothetical protein